MIHFFGDSFTYCQGCNPGEEYYDRTYDGTQKTWVELLSEYVDDDFQNHGQCGIGNDKLFDNILEKLYIIDSDDYVIISRASDTRFMVPNSVGHHEQVIINLLLDENYKYKNWTEEVHGVVRNYFTKVIVPYLPAVSRRYNELFSFIEKYFNSKGISYLKWNVDDHILTDDGKAKYSIISDEHADIDDSHWSWKGHQEFFEFIKDKL